MDFSKVKRPAALLAAALAGVVGGSQMAETDVMLAAEPIARPVKYNVIIQAGKSTYELSYPDSVQLRELFQPWAKPEVGQLHSVACTSREAMHCKFAGLDGTETIQLTGDARMKAEAFARLMFRGKLEDISRFDCTMRVEHDVCMALGSKMVAMEELKAGDTVLRLGVPAEEAPTEEVPTTTNTGAKK